MDHGEMLQKILHADIPFQSSPRIDSAAQGLITKVIPYIALRCFSFADIRAVLRKKSNHTVKSARDQVAFVFCCCVRSQCFCSLGSLDLISPLCVEIGGLLLERASEVWFY